MYLNFFRYGGEACAELRLEPLQGSSRDGGFGSCRESMVHVSKGFGGLREPLRLSIRLFEQHHEARTLLDLRLNPQYLDCALGLAGFKEGRDQQRKRGIPSCSC